MSGVRKYRVSPELSVHNNNVTIGCGSRDLEETTHVRLGRLSEQGQSAEVWWSFEQETVLGVFGRRGSGKSYTLGVFLESLGATAKESTIGRNLGDRAVLVFDTLNIFQHSLVSVADIADEELREQAERNLKVYGLEPPGQEPGIDLSFPAGHSQPFYTDRYEEFTVNTALIQPEDYGHIFGLDVYREPMGQLLLAGYDKIKDTGYVGDSESIPGSEEAGLEELIDCLENDPQIANDFAVDSIRGVVSRLRGLHREAVFGTSPTTLNDLLRPGRVRVLLLGHLDPPLRSVVAGLIVRQLFNLRAKAAEAKKFLRLHGKLEAAEREEAERIVRSMPPRTLVCIDEAQGYAPPTKSNPCTGILIQYVKEGRNHGLSLVVTTQQPSAVHGEVLSQMDAAVSHRLSVASDIKVALQNAKSRSPKSIISSRQELSEAELLRDLGTGQAHVSHSDVERSFVMKVRPRVTAHGGIEG